MWRHVKNVALILCVQAIEIPVVLLSYLVVPIALLQCKPEDENLPRWARYWQTYDYGINGDEPWAGPEHANGHQTEYLWRLKWLLRNKTGVFSHEVTGFDQFDVFSYYTEGDVLTGNRPGHSGYLYAEAHLKNGRMYPCYYIVHQLGNSNQCFRLYAGWKFRQAKRASLWPKSGIAQFVVSINPFQFFEW